MDVDAVSSLLPRQYQNERSRSSRLATGAIVGIAIACFVVVVVCLLCCWFCCCRKRRGKNNPGGGGGGMMGKLGSMIPGNNPPSQHQQPGMQEAGYGYGGAPPQQYPPQGGGYGEAPPQQYPPQGGGYGYSNPGYGPQPPQPAYR